METSPERQKNPIFRERGDGLGWKLNFDNKWSYVILVLFLIAVTICIVWASNQKS